MFHHRRRRGSVVEFALLVPLIALLSLAFFDLTRAMLQQFRLERLSASLARALALSRLPTADDLRVYALARLASVSPTIEVSVDIRAVPSSTVTFPRDARPIEIVDLSLSEPIRSIVLWRSPLRLRAAAREVRAR